MFAKVGRAQRRQSRSDITIESFSHFEKFYDTINNNSQLGIKVKVLILLFDIDEFCKDDKEKISWLLTNLLTTSLPYLERLIFNDLYTCVPEMYTLLSNQLKNMKRITMPTKFRCCERANYLKCVQSMMDRLEVISILPTPEFSLNPVVDMNYERLYDDLHLFKNLTGIYIDRRTHDGIGMLEHITEACQSLKNIQLRLITLNDNVTIDTMALAKYTPRLNVEWLKIDMRFSNDCKLLLYLTHKFPGVQTFELSLEESEPLHDQYVVAPLLNYVSKIKEFFISGLREINNDFLETFGNHWEKTSTLGNETVRAIYPGFFIKVEHTSLQIERKGHGGRITTTFKCSRDAERESYMDLLEKSGKFIGTLRINDERDCGTVYLLKLREDFFPRMLSYCPNLKNLTIVGARMKLFTIPNVHNKISLNELYLQYCSIESGMLEQLSLFVCEIKQLRLHYNESHATNHAYNLPLEMIMPQTVIQCIIFERSPWGNSIVYIKVFSMADKHCHYYRTGEKNDDWRFSTEQEYTAKNNQRLVHIKCQQIKEFKIKVVEGD